MRWIARKQLVLWLGLALVVRLAAGLYWHSRQAGGFGMGDSEGYFTLGQTIAAGRPYEYGPDGARLFRAPGYPLLLAPIFYLVSPQHAVLAARVENALVGTLVVLGVWWLARQLFGDRAALLAAAMAALYPESVAASAMVLSETPFCALMLLQLGLWMKACQTESPRRAALWAFFAGLAAGAATLVRPSWLLFTPLAALLAVIVSRQKSSRHTPCAVLPRTACADYTAPARWRHATIAAAMLVAMIVVMTPWWIRNARLTGHFVPTTLQVGASLYDGWSPHATGASDMRYATRLADEYRRQQPAAADQFPAAQEYRTDRYLRAAAVGWARAHPGAAFRLVGIKLLRMWNVWPNEASFSSWPVRLVVAVSYLPVVALGLLGVFRTLSSSAWRYILCWLPACYFSALHTVFVASIRYRQPAMLGLMVLAAGVLASRSTAGCLSSLCRTTTEGCWPSSHA